MIENGIASHLDHILREMWLRGRTSGSGLIVALLVTFSRDSRMPFCALEVVMSSLVLCDVEMLTFILFHTIS